jgi:hypothetical protein
MKIAKKNTVYYLAGPFSSPNLTSKQIEANYHLHIQAAIVLTKDGFNLFEPIARCHHAAKREAFPVDYEFWKTQDRQIIKRSDGIIVLVIPGWDKSIGVKDEIQYGKRLGKKVYYFDVNSLTLSLEPPIIIKKAASSTGRCTVVQLREVK